MQFPQLKFDLGEDIDMLRDSVHAFAQDEIAPRAAMGAVPPPVPVIVPVA